MRAQSNPNGSLLNNWVIKILSFMTAVFLVLAIRFMGINSRTVHIPLDVTLPDSGEYVPVSLIPDSIDIVITGDDSIIYLVDPSQITASADFSDVNNGEIERRNVVLEYDHDIFSRNSLTLQAKPATVRILFEEVSN